MFVLKKPVVVSACLNISEVGSVEPNQTISQTQNPFHFLWRRKTFSLQLPFHVFFSVQS